MLRSFLNSSYPDLDCEIIVDQTGGGVGRAVMRLLQAAGNSPHALVVLGDTIAEFSTQGDRSTRIRSSDFGPVDWNRNWVLYDIVDDPERWCIWDRKSRPAMFVEKKDFELERFGGSAIFSALVGVYYFCDAEAACKAAEELDSSPELCDKPMEMSHVLNKLNGQPIGFYKARFWVDAGHPDRLILGHAILLERDG